jgi:hypothetical protein
MAHKEVLLFGTAKIRTSYNPSAIRWTWTAQDESLIGCGITEQEAVRDLMRRLREHYIKSQREDMENVWSLDK